MGIVHSPWFLPVWLSVAMLVPVLMKLARANWRAIDFTVAGLLTIMSPLLLFGLVPSIGDGWLVAAALVLSGACLLQALLEELVKWKAFGERIGQRYRLFGMTIAIAGILLLVGFVVSNVTVTEKQLAWLAVAAVAAFSIAGLQHRHFGALLQYIAFGAKKTRLEQLKL